MRRLLLLFAAFLVAGCGEKSSSEGSDSAGESAEPSADTAQPADNSFTLPLSDADIERLLKKAIDRDSLNERDNLLYQLNKSEPFSGWVKEMYDSGQVLALGLLKDGTLEGPYMWWNENGQKRQEGIYKDGEVDGPYMLWHDNGQKMAEGTYKDGESVSGKYWNSKGEEVENLLESQN